MAIYRMLRTGGPDSDHGGLWHTYLTTSGTSDTYLLPEQKIYALGASITTTSGAGSLQFSMDSEARVRAGTATFSAWDGTADINFAVTAFKLVATSGLIGSLVAVKTDLAS